MAVTGGLASQFMIVKESTAGTAVTPTLALPLVSESLSHEKTRLEAEGIISGRRTIDPSQWNGGVNTVGGDLGLELQSPGLGRMFEAIFGTVGTTGSGPYTHAFVPGDLPSYTVQIGRPTNTGSVIPFTYSGCKVASWELACEAGSVATLGVTWAGMIEQAGTRSVTDGATTNASPTITSATAAFAAGDEGKGVTGTGIPAGTRILRVNSATSVLLSANATATATGLTLVIGMPLATVAYPTSPKLLKFDHAAVTVAGTSVPVKAVTFSGDNGLDTERRFLGSGNPSSPLEAGMREYGGTLDVEWSDLTQYNRFLNGTEVALVVTFTLAGVAAVSIGANIRMDGGGPTVSGREIVQQSIPFKCIGAVFGDAGALNVTLINGDSGV